MSENHIRVGFYSTSAADCNKNLNQCLTSVITFLERNHNYTAEIVLVGESHVDGDLLANHHVTSLPLSMKRMGKISQQDMGDLFFPAIDVFMCLSHFETFSQISFECLTYGIPVLTYDDIGPADYVVHLKTGFVLDRSKPMHLLRRVLF